MLLSGTNYTYKLAIAILLTPLIYAAHAAIDKYIGEQEAEALIEQTAILNESESEGSLF